MCGISGFVDFTKSKNIDLLDRFISSQNHRGNDDFGRIFLDFLNVNIGLAHNRLAIIDCSELGRQPMQKGNQYIVFNGEIYNYKLIRQELIELGFGFTSLTDTEVVLTAYKQWGLNCFSKFIGMFAFAIVDLDQSKIIIVRDRAGVKPLYYSFDDNGLTFGSELKIFHNDVKISKELCSDAIALYFKYGYIPAPYSIFKQIKKLPPASILVYDFHDKSYKINTYWDVLDFYRKPKFTYSETELIHQVEELLISSCEYRMVSDVPVGIFLSGGVDSSCVASVLQNNRTSKIKSFTIGFEDQKWNEAEYAKKIAEYIGTDHSELYCTLKDVEEILPELTFFYDEPFADSSAIPTMIVSKFARKSVKVALSADGGDELFGGYSKYSSYLNIVNTFSKIPVTLHQSIGNLMKISKSAFKFLEEKKYRFDYNYHILKSALTERNLSTSNLLKEASTFIPEHKLSEFLINYRNSDISYFSQQNNFLDLSALDQMLLLDYKTYMVDDILCKIDRATMHVSLEGREPLLDHRLIEFMAQVPDEWKIRRGQKKYLLKKILSNYVPESLFERPKMGFGLPIVNWFRKELKIYFDEFLNEDEIVKQGLFNLNIINFWKSQYFKGRSEYFEPLWALLVFQMWYKKWVT